MSDRERAAIERAYALHLARTGGHFEAVRDQTEEKLRDDVRAIVAAYNAALQDSEGQASDPRAQSEAKQGSENPNSPSLLASSRAPKPADQKPGFHETMDREAVEPPERVVPQPGEDVEERERRIAKQPCSSCGLPRFPWLSGQVGGYCICNVGGKR